jgi:hypothetical protein
MLPHQAPENIPEKEEVSCQMELLHPAQGDGDATPENEVAAPEPEQPPEEEWLADPAFQPFRLRLEPEEPLNFEEWDSEEELELATSLDGLKFHLG